MRVGQCLIDANWGASTDVVYQFCRQSRFASTLLPSHGKYVGASSMPMGEHKRKRGDRVGLNWKVPSVTGKRSVRHVVFDTNFWKTFVHARLATSIGDPGALTLFGRKPEQHRMIAEHLTAEYRVKTQGRGRTVDEWKLRLKSADNHLLDCMVGNTVAASMLGATMYDGVRTKTKKKRIKLSELQRSK